MGLDMWLNRRAKATEEVAYWRKANMIHDWFANRLAEGDIENCRSYVVSKEDLEDLRNTCERVLNGSKIVQGMVTNGQRLNSVTGKWEDILEPGEVIEDPSIAQELLPVAQGFFFGSQKYDEYYIEDLKYTIKQIDKVLEETDFDEDEITYTAWW